VPGARPSGIVAVAMTASIHDALFKSTFADPRNAEGALRVALPSALAARIDWSTLQLEPGSFVDEDLKDRHTDLLFSASVAGRRALLYLLYEHQSRPHPLMPVRFVGYLARIWESWLANNPEATRVPAILPVVLHHGPDGWTKARSLEELYDLDEETLAVAGDHLLRLRFVLDDIGVAEDEALRARAMTALGRLVFYSFRHARDPAELIEGLVAWRDLVSELRAAPNGAAALGRVWRYVMMVHPGKPEVILQQLAVATKDGSAQEDVVTAGETLIALGEQRGERRMLLTVLSGRFGALPEWIVARMNAADARELEALGERLATALTLDDLFPV
jgi:hypothetical protein